MRLLAPPLNTIWKFLIPIEDEFSLSMPEGSLPLSVGMQEGIPVLWAAVNSMIEEREEHRFFLRGTGQLFPRLLDYRFVGTFQIESLELAYHLFDAGPLP